MTVELSRSGSERGAFGGHHAIRCRFARQRTVGRLVIRAGVSLGGRLLLGESDLDVLFREMLTLPIAALLGSSHDSHSRTAGTVATAATIRSMLTCTRIPGTNQILSAPQWRTGGFRSGNSWVMRGESGHLERRY